MTTGIADEKHYYQYFISDVPWSKTIEGAIVDSFAQNGFVVLRQAVNAHELRDVWSAYAALCFVHCFEIMYQNGRITEAIDKTDSNEFTMKQGIKHGYAEVVMRSPGRYEISLKHLLQVQDWDDSSLVKRQTHGNLLPLLPHHPQKMLRSIKSLLTKFLGDVYEEKNTRADDRESPAEQDEMDTNLINCKLIHLSLLIATPGSCDQAWHADGGHVSLDQHLPCHSYNIFIPLQDTPHDLGPTELRPASHYLTRGSLPKNMLLAKCRKTLQAPVWPSLNLGDVLIFDYRILHRGRTNSLNINRNYLVLTYAQPWFHDVLNFPKRSMYDQRCAGADRVEREPSDPSIMPIVSSCTTTTQT